MNRNEILRKLDANKTVVKPMQGVAWYNMLCNPDYIQDYAYITTNNPKRDELIVDDDENEGNDCEQPDLVALILNLALVKEEVVKDLVFGTGMSEQVKKYQEQAKSGNFYAKLED